MIGEYQRINVVQIKHVCGHVETYRNNRQPGFGLIVDSISSRSCPACAVKVNDERYKNYLQD